MSNLNYPVASGFFPLSENNWVKKNGDVNRIVQRKELFNFVLNSEVGSRIKFILGFIYFFSLLFFTIILFT
jgi:hypothetical protein